MCGKFRVSSLNGKHLGSLRLNSVNLQKSCGAFTLIISHLSVYMKDKQGELFWTDIKCHKSLKLKLLSYCKQKNIVINHHSVVKRQELVKTREVPECAKSNVEEYS